MAVAFNAGNLKPVAKILREKFPDLPIVVCADNDTKTEGNPGVTKATEAAAAVDGLVASPDASGDFNDLANTRDAEAVRKAVDVAEKPSRTNEVILNEAASLDDIAFEQQRKPLADELGIRISTLDAERKKKRKETEEQRNHLFLFQAPESWPNEVSGVALLASMETLFSRYLVLPKGASTLMSLWTLHTYCFDSISLSPFLTFTSPTKQCGKSTAMDLLGALAHKVLLVSNASPSAIYRAIEKWQPTLLFDEGDAFIRNNEDIRCILNASHKKRGASVLRCVGDDHEPKLFKVWAPKALATIGRLQSTLMDRSIVIEMQRKRLTDKAEPLEDEMLDGPEFENLRRQCVRWADDNLEAVRKARPSMRHDLNDRVADNWRTLMKVAEIAGWREQADYALAKLIPQSDDADDLGPMLLADIRMLFGSEHDVLASDDLVVQLTNIDERPWPDLSRGRGLTKSRLANLLKPYKIRPRSVRIGDRTPKGYRREDFKGPWERYLSPATPAQSATTPQPINSKGYSDSEAATSPPDVALENQPKPLPGNDCGGVADRKGDDGRERLTI